MPLDFASCAPGLIAGGMGDSGSMWTEGDMVRSLAIRQAFVLAEVFLAILAVVAIVLVGGMVGNTKRANPVGNSDIEPSDGVTLRIASVKSFENYDAIVTGGLFGEAGRWDPDAAPPPLPPEPELTELEETKLNLKLTGAVASSLMNDPFAGAFIADGDKKTPSRAFWIGDEVVDRVTLIEVYHREVILLNARNTPERRERLSMDDAENEAPVVRPTRRSPRRSTTASQRISLKRTEIQKELLASYADISKLKPEPVKDASGKVIGITAGEISGFPLAKKLGLEDNDVFTSVNNEKIDSIEKVMELTNKYRNAETLKIGILRNGKKETITYNLQ